MNGSLILLLHAHLPFVKHPEYEYSLEENWLFEAVRESYVPMIEMLDRLADKGMSPHIAMTISPTLSEMLNDTLLRERFIRSTENLIELSCSEINRLRNTPFEQVARFYNRRLKKILGLYTGPYKQDIINALCRLQSEGVVEIMTTCATHAFLPAFEHFPELAETQIAVGIMSYKRNFGRQPSGFWLPECGYYTGLDALLKKVNIRYFFLESHGLTKGIPKPRFGVSMPVVLPSGLIAFGRDSKPAKQVWCAETGYPGDDDYRDFYRDVGFDLPVDYISGHTKINIPTFTGLKYHRITGRTPDKAVYDRGLALKKAKKHAAHFVKSRKNDLRKIGDECKPLTLSAFDAELFGHWWFEGVEWLGHVLETASKRGLGIETPQSYLRKIEDQDLDVLEPAPSSWGAGGYNEFWISGKNRHYHRELHAMAGKMKILAELNARTGPKNGKKGALCKRTINQALREMLLAQSSDWLFLIENQRGEGYAEARLKKHIQTFDKLFSMAGSGEIDTETLEETEKRDSLFKWATIENCYKRSA
ncbi:MAG: DUF1957 domain-containing protein [Nitrospirae bacterium]|nr:MAG: DUF1957 domain-containing protein [Nitrospirota bacterium]